ncbi:MAG: hypothetical protein J6Q05_02585 [Elusimicrobiaceae bacterium]|nr:hypothetical protein [Elusimicrobiaceae bacterium]
MKKLVVFVVLSIPTVGLSSTLSDQLERVAANALTRATVQVQVKLAKPIYMSDVMFRPVRGGRDTVIRVDYKEQTCTGHLSAQETHVIVPVSCVQDDNYKADQINLMFADGRQIKKTGKSVVLQNKQAHIRL